MGLLANNHLGERGLFAYLSSRLGLLKNYVPFGDVPEAHWQLPSVFRHRSMVLLNRVISVRFSMGRSFAHELQRSSACPFFAPVKGDRQSGCGNLARAGASESTHDVSRGRSTATIKSRQS